MRLGAILEIAAAHGRMAPEPAKAFRAGMDAYQALRVANPKLELDAKLPPRVVLAFVDNKPTYSAELIRGSDGVWGLSAFTPVRVRTDDPDAERKPGAIARAAEKRARKAARGRA